MLPQLSFPRELPRGSQLLSLPSIAPVQPYSLASVVTAQAAPLSIPHASAQVTTPSISMHYIPAPPVSFQAPSYTAAMPRPVQPTLIGSLPPMHATSSQQPQSVYSEVPNPSVTDLLVASVYRIPRPSLPVFKSGRESDLAILKMAME